MTDKMELVHGSGNIFRDMGVENPEIEYLKAILAAHIIKLLDKKKLTVRQAAALTGLAAADFSRIRNVKLDRFTIDRLMTILSRFGQKIDVSVSLKKDSSAARPKSKAA